ncbi:unnamed protein product, partial [Ectocarpus sp. 8 AP-2014]
MGNVCERERHADRRGRRQTRRQTERDKRERERERERERHASGPFCSVSGTADMRPSPCPRWRRGTATRDYSSQTFVPSISHAPVGRVVFIPYPTRLNSSPTLVRFCSNGVAYLVVVAESVTSKYFTTLLDMTDLEADDPPPVCAAPSAGRFEITGHDSFNMSIAHHDRYFAYLVVCDRGGSFYGHVTSTFLNRVPEGDLTQHLPINQAMLP